MEGPGQCSGKYFGLEAEAPAAVLLSAVTSDKLLQRISSVKMSPQNA